MFIFALHAPILPLVAKGPSFPIPYSVGVTADGGVARTVEAYTAMPTDDDEGSQDQSRSHFFSFSG